MQQPDEVEVLFCDLCGTSVPVTDLERGAAIRHQAKTIGACCLGVLRQGDSPLANPGLANPGGAVPAPGAPAPAGSPAAAAVRPPSEGRLLPVAVFLLAAIAAATIYLDQKIAVVDQAVQSNHAQSSLAQRSDSDVLQGLGVAMDAVARKADVDAIAERLVALDGSLKLAEEQTRQQTEALRQGLAAVQQETRLLSAVSFDSRPLFDELRQGLQRVQTAVADLRLAAPGPAAAPPAEAAAPKPPTPAAPEAGGLPEALQGQVQKLGNADAAIRFEAVDALVASKNPAVLKHLLPMVRDADSFVRRLTADGLQHFRSGEAVEALIAALGDTDKDVAEAAWNSLKKLTGQKIAFDARSPSQEAKQRAQQRWQEWWEKNKATFGS